MLAVSQLVAFVASTDLERSRAFYADVLGLTLREASDFGLVFDTTNTSLRVSKVERLIAPDWTVLGWEVAELAAAVRQLNASGVACQRYEGMPQDELGVWIAPGGAQVAWFKDPDGNTLSLTQAASE